jgi:ATP-dependent DNA ligase
VETDGGGRGEVGSFQATDAQLQWMWDNRDVLRGQVAEIHVQEITKSGAPRAGVFYRWHPSKSEAALLMYSLDDRSSMYAMKSAAGWRRK